MVSRKLMQKGIDVVWITSPFVDEEVKASTYIGKIYDMPWASKRERMSAKMLYPLYVLLLVPFIKVKAVYFSSYSIRNAIILNLLISFFKNIGKIVIYSLGDMPVIYEKEVRGKSRPKFVEKFLLHNLLLSCTKTDLLITRSWNMYRFMRKSCKRLGGCKKIQISRYGADLRYFNRHTSSYGIRQQYNLNDHFLIGWIGHGRKKKVIPIIEALSYDFEGEDISFIVGGHIDYEKLKKIEKQTGIRIIRLGYVPHDISAKIYKECDLIIAPLDLKMLFYHIAFSSKIFEASALGKPVVATVPKGNRGIIRNLPNVIAVDDEPRSFVVTVRHLMGHYSKYNSISKNLSSDVINRISMQYSTDREVKSILKAISHRVAP